MFMKQDPLLVTKDDQDMVEGYALEHNLVEGQEFERVRGNPDAEEIDVTTMNFRFVI